MESAVLYKSPKVRSLICLIVFSIFMGFAIQGCASLKITDPSHPEFQESEFRFEDYAEFRKFRTAMEAMFPVGTPRSKIDHMLIEIGGAAVFTGPQNNAYPKVKPGEKIVRYIKQDRSGPLVCHFRVRAIYNSHETLSEKIFAYYGCTGP